MHRGPTRQYEVIFTVGEVARAFVAAALPPEPPLAPSADVRESLDQALVALGRLDSVSTLLPDTELFLG